MKLQTLIGVLLCLLSYACAYATATFSKTSSVLAMAGLVFLMDDACSWMDDMMLDRVKDFIVTEYHQSRGSEPWIGEDGF